MEHALSPTVSVNLAEFGLEKTEDGQHVQWASGSALHPWHWSGARKFYDMTLILLLEAFTCVPIVSLTIVLSNMWCLREIERLSAHQE